MRSNFEFERNLEDTFWSKQENITDNFRAIGMTALYDFEAVGGFVYDDYPSYYGKGE